jgi:hypothetical protein
MPSFIDEDGILQTFSLAGLEPGSFQVAGIIGASHQYLATGKF